MAGWSDMEEKQSGNKKYPKCPFCKAIMKPCEFVGYYDSFIYWECQCNKFPDDIDVHKAKGAYA